jgi:pimeloyl-ACP methyl ester carboxylesterase
VVKHLRSQGGISSIGLWGRSMGAVTALLYSHLDPDIAGMVSLELLPRVLRSYRGCAGVWLPACAHLRCFLQVASQYCHASRVRRRHAGRRQAHAAYSWHLSSARVCTPPHAQSQA